MRATTLWTALSLSTVLFAATASAEKTTYTNQPGQPMIRPEAAPQFGGAATHPGMMPPAQGPQGYGPQAYGPQMPMGMTGPMMMPQPGAYGAVPASYGMGMGPYGGQPMMDPNVMPTGYPGAHAGGPVGAACATCNGAGCDGCLGRGGLLGPGGCVGCNGAGCGDCCGLSCCLLGGEFAYCGFGRGIGQPWDLSAYGGRSAPRYFDVAVDATYFIYEPTTQLTQLSSQGAANNFVLDTDDVNFDHEGGVRITAQRTCFPGSFLEFSYLGIGNWSSGSSVSGAGDLFSPFSDFGVDPVGGYAETDGSDLHAFSTSNRFDSFELNLRRFWTAPSGWWHGSYWGGLRYVRVEDDATYFTQGAGDSLDYDVRVNNDLFGVQIGGDLAMKLTTRLSISGFAEVGVFGNRGNQESSLEFGNVEIREGATEERASLVTEAGAMATFRINPRGSFRVGYQIVYIDGIALASDAFDFDTPGAGTLGTALAGRQGRINDNGNALYHGPTAGFEYAW